MLYFPVEENTFTQNIKNLVICYKVFYTYIALIVMYVIYSCHVWRHSSFQQPLHVDKIYLDARHTLAGSPAWFTSIAGLQSQFNHNAEILPDALAPSAFDKVNL